MKNGEAFLDKNNILLYVGESHIHPGASVFESKNGYLTTIMPEHIKSLKRSQVNDAKKG